MKDIDYGRGKIRIQTSEYKGKNYLDIRKFFELKDTGEWKPTTKGISLPIELAEEVLNTALEVIRTNK